jgi:hypothetical protein
MGSDRPLFENPLFLADFLLLGKLLLKRLDKCLFWVYTQ